MAPKYKTKIDGLLVVDKPLGLSSMDVVRRVRHAAGFCKTGHAGTLDPLATGVVICCLGKATKAVNQLMADTKVYETTIDLSAFTNTDDREGELQPVAVTAPPGLAEVENVLPQFVGTIDQQPPLYSAIHIGGQRAYKIARKGNAEGIEIPTRQVVVHGIRLLDYAWPNLSLEITCGKGTYIRALGRDIGKALGTGGHLASLRRTAVGDYHVDQAVTIERLEEPVLQEHLLPIPGATTPSPPES